MAKPLLGNKEAKDKFAQQAGFKDYDDLAEQYSKDPNSWVASKGKITGDEQFTAEQVQNYIEQDIMNRKGNKSAPAPSSDYNKAVVENYSPEELAGKKGLADVTNSAVQADSVVETDPTEAAISKVKAGEASDDDLRLAFESGYVGGPKTQEAYRALGLVKEDNSLKKEPVDVEPVSEEPVSTEGPSERTKKAEEVAKYLGARSVIAAYKDGDFGKIYKGKKDSELTEEQLKERKAAKRTLGNYILDAIGTTLLNTSAVARGGSPTEVSKWEQRQSEINAEEIARDKERLGGPSERKKEQELLDIAAKEKGLTTQDLRNEYQKLVNEYTPQQLEQQVKLVQEQIAQMGLTTDNMTDARTFINQLKAKENPSTLDNLMIAWMSQAGTGSAIQGGSATLSNMMNWLLTLVK